MITTNINTLVDEGQIDLAMLREALYYNPETGNFTSRKHTGVRVKGSIASNGYLRVFYRGKHYFAHRLAWYYTHGKWPSADIDHINGNPSDNRLLNLREASRARNTHNQKLRRNNTSGARCVTFERSTGKWRVAMTRFGHKFFLGSYRDKDYAIAHANEFLRKSDSEFFSDVTAKHDLPEDQIALLAFIRKSKDLGPDKLLAHEKRAWVAHMLCGWGRWAHEGLEGQSKISPIGRFMESVSGRGAITADGIVAIMEGLHKRGYSGTELIKKLSQFIANMKHGNTPACTDEEGMFIDRLIMHALGRNSPLLRVAVNYYVYGHQIESIAQYLQRITRDALTMPQARDRVKWCIRLIEARMYNAIHAELDKQEENQLKVA